LEIFYKYCKDLGLRYRHKHWIAENQVLWNAWGIFGHGNM